MHFYSMPSIGSKRLRWRGDSVRWGGGCGAGCGTGVWGAVGAVGCVGVRSPQTRPSTGAARPRTARMPEDRTLLRINIKVVDSGSFLEGRV